MTWRGGEVARYNGDGTYEVRYKDGAVAHGVPEKDLQCQSAGESTDSPALSAEQWENSGRGTLAPIMGESSLGAAKGGQQPARKYARPWDSKAPASGPAAVASTDEAEPKLGQKGITYGFASGLNDYR